MSRHLVVGSVLAIIATLPAAGQGTGARKGGFLEGAAAFVEKVRVIHEIRSTTAGEQFGWVARRIGDVDGDGVVDFATSAPTRAGGGRVFVYSSKKAELLFTRDGEPGQSYGQGVGPAGDVNGDGTPDVIVGAPANGKGKGRAHVLSGRDGKLIHELTSGDMNDWFGIKVCGCEDLDGDGRPELVVGASGADEGGKDTGSVYVFSGKTGEELDVVDGTVPGEKLGSSVDATRAGGHALIVAGAMGYRGRGRAYAWKASAKGLEPFFTIEASKAGARLGMYFVTIIGDVDADGVPDVYASDWADSSKAKGAGRVYVHSGKTGKRILTIDGHRAGENFGTSSSYAGDCNGDGHADLIVGAWQNADGGKSAGACYLHSGSDGSLLTKYTSAQSGDTLGFDSQGIGDVDGDGAIDFLLTSAWSAINGKRSGRIFIVAGPRPRRD